MEAAKSSAGGAGQRHRGRGPALYHRPWSPVSGAGTSGVHRPGGVALVRAGGPRGGGGGGAGGARGVLGRGGVPLKIIVGILLVKSTIWAVSLGSGTSGGVLAPLLMMGGALGGIEAMFLPHEGAGFWPLVSMGAILCGPMRSPFTGVIFALELTHDVNMLLPLLLAVTIAHAFTVLTLRRSILTEKVARRGYHLSREYAVDPLEILFVREVMRTNVAALPARLTGSELAQALHTGHTVRQGQHLYPILDDERRLGGVVTRGDLEGFAKG